MDPSIERWVEHAAESAGAAIVVHAPDTSIVWANREASRILGVSRDDLTGKLAADPEFRLLDDQGEPLPLERFPVVMALETRATVDDYVVGAVRPDSAIAWGKIGAETLVRDGEVQAVVVTFVDITELRAAQQAQEKLREKAETAARLESLGVLAGGLAHDFNNLLVGVLGAADLAREVLDQPDELAGLLDTIQQSALRAADLTQQLMAYAGRAPNVLAILDLEAEVRELVRLVKNAAGRDADIQQRHGTGLVVEADPTQLRQVLLNLLVNACEALPNGQGAVRLRTVPRAVEADEARALGCAPGRYAALVVEDEGVGMDEATQARVFEPFFTTKPAGHGLGLAAVLGLVRSHRGFVTVDSAPGRGTRFELGLPRSAQSLEGSGPGAPAPATPRARRVVVVDDEEMVRKVTCRMLRMDGFEVDALADGTKLEARLEETGAPDLLLLDVSMPRISGPQLLAQIRPRYPDLPVILMSGHVDTPERVELSGGEATAFLAKPFRRQELQAKVRGLLPE